MRASHAGRVILSLASLEECEIRTALQICIMSQHCPCLTPSPPPRRKMPVSVITGPDDDDAESRRPDSLCPATKAGSGFVPATPIVQLIGGTGCEQSGTQEPQ